MMSDVLAFDDAVISLTSHAQKFSKDSNQMEGFAPEDDEVCQGWEVLNLTLAAAQQCAADAQKLASEQCPPDEVARLNDMAQEMLGHARELSAALTSDKRGRKARVQRVVGKCGALGVGNFRNASKAIAAAAVLADEQAEANNQQINNEAIDYKLENNGYDYNPDSNNALSGGGILRVALTSGTNLGKVATFAAGNFVEDAKFAEHLAAMRKLSPEHLFEEAGDVRGRKVEVEKTPHSKRTTVHDTNTHDAGDIETTKRKKGHFEADADVNKKGKVNLEKNAVRVEKAAADVADDVADAAGDTAKTGAKIATKEAGFFAKMAKFGKKLIPFAGGAVTAIAAKEADANIDAAVKAGDITEKDAEKIRDFNKAKVANDTFNPFLVIGVVGEHEVKKNLEKQVSEKAASLALSSTAEDLAELAGGSKAGTKHYKKLTDDKAELKKMAADEHDPKHKLAAAKLKVMQVRASADDMGLVDMALYGITKTKEFNKAQDDFNAEAEKYENEVKNAATKAKTALAEKKPEDAKDDKKHSVAEVKDGHDVAPNVGKDVVAKNDKHNDDKKKHGV